MSLTSRVLGPFRRSLRARLVGYFLALSTITVLVVGAIVYWRATGDLTASVYERLDAVAGLKADALDRWIDEQSRNVVFVGVMPGVGDDARVFLDSTSGAAARTAAEASLREILATVVSQTADAEEILILDLDGTIRMSTLADHEGLSLADEDFFITGSSHTNVQNAYRSSLTGRPTITVATPLFDQDGKGQRVAIVAAHLSLQRVDRIVLDRTGLGATGQAYLVGTDGVPIQGTGGVTGPLHSTAVDAIVAGQSGRGLYTNPDGTPVIGVYSWIEDRNAGLIAEMSQDEAFGSARQLALVIGIVGLASALLLAAGIWVVARRVTRPILSLAATASRVQGGDLEATSGFRSDDEVGVLATAFDDMTAELRENVATLERRVVERTAEISRQKQYFEALVEVSPVAIVTMDRDERVSAWNPAATTLFGYTPTEAIGKTIDDLILGSDELRQEGHDLSRAATETGRSHLISQRMRKEGSAMDVEIVMVPLIVDGEHIGFYAIYHDITELQAARREADSANQAKSAFLAAMSHEIRTPMNAVIGMSGLLLDTTLNEEQRDYAESISISGEALLTIINDILDFSKIEAGRFELESVPFDLRRTVRAAADLIRPNAATKGLELQIHELGEAPPQLLGDAGRIRQIVLNLLSNALKFTEHGRIDLTIEATPLDGRWQVSISVKDTGIGITPGGMGRLFQSFSQADASIARRYGGTGLGLVISRRLAELMGGSLTAESAGIPGEGSRFDLSFAADAAAAETLKAASAGDGRQVAAAVNGGRPMRILLAEDNAMNQKLAMRLLEKMGLSADLAVNGLEALAAVERTPYDVILMDVQMPEMDGLEATRQIRAAGPAHRPRIIAMTANAMEGDREACLAAGMDDYLSKPIRPEALATALGGAAAQHETTATA
ncbi:MAG TPA: response regulator [Candidatus Polarisedimenticolia bacterium]|nr:response regulator [Candidatus Polarisedimenticolia bacterium]